MKKNLILVIFLFFSWNHLHSQDVTQWRGSDRSGVYHESGLLQSWPPEGPSLIWESGDIGNGYGSPVITGDVIYVNGEVDSITFLFALDHTGKVLWKTPVGKEWVTNYPGSRTTPTLVDDLIYVTAGWGQLACLEAKTGKQRWACNMMSDFHGAIPRFGFSESVLVEGNTVYCSPGSPDTNVVALDRFTGKIQWISKGAGEMTSYCSPVLVRLPQRTLLLTFSKATMLGIDIKDGTVLWTYKQDGEEVDCQCNTPLFENGFIYGVAGNGNGAFKLKLSDDGTQIKEVWRNNRCDGLFGGFIKTGNQLFSSGYEKRQYFVLDTETGAITDSLKFDRGSVIMADRMLYFYNEKGSVGLIKPGGPKLEQKGVFKVTRGTKAHFAHPVICNKILYVRHGKSLLAYKVSAQ
jgi:outer membrane protein assembly factor BamB